MEIIAEFIIQIVWGAVKVLGELFLQVFGELIVELIGRSLHEPFRRPKPRHPFLALIGYGLFGAIIGAISLWALPSPIISTHWLRVVNLIVTPVVAGFLMERLGAWRERNHPTRERLNRFAYGYVFALSMAVVRFTWGH